jgi:hypothetical protein
MPSELFGSSIRDDCQGSKQNGISLGMSNSENRFKRGGSLELVKALYWTSEPKDHTNKATMLA